MTGAITNRPRPAPLLALTALLLSACAGNPAPGTGGSTPGTTTPFGKLTTLKPGAQGVIEQKLKVNVVSIGFRSTLPGQVAGPRDLNFDAFRAQLPTRYTSVNRYPSFYGNLETTGNNFEFDYNTVSASTAFEDAFFKFLMDNGTERSVIGTDGLKYVNLGAAFYNCQTDSTADLISKVSTPSTVYACPTPAGNIAREVTGNFEVDGAAVEKWLADNAGQYGIDTTEHTVFLINWYGRPDFKFHSYSHLRKDDSVETDTRVNFGARSSRRTIAWGGTPSQDQNAAKRLWFLDISANPDYWSSAYNVSSSDVDGDKIYDKRVFPIWEYGTRKASYAYGEKVSADLGKVTRYVAIDLLFTPSALYRVSLTPPDMPENLNLDIAIEQGAGATDASLLIQPKTAQDRLQPLQPFAKWSNSVRTTALSGDLATAYNCFFPAAPEDVCSPDYADANGELFFQQALAEIRTRAQATPGTYNLPTYLFNDANEDAVNQNLLGRAIDDGSTGTQTLTANFLTPLFINAGYGFTDTVVHESGHHLSQSHPHDGYDSEQDYDFGPSGDTRFVDLGDEVHSVMSYNNLSKTFGQFNLDAQYRYLTAAYLTNANAVLALTQGAGKADATGAAVRTADQTFASAVNAYQNRRYMEAATLAHTAYQSVISAAKDNGVNVQAYKWYDRVSELSAGTAKPKAANNLRPIQGQGPVMRPEETGFQRSKRLAP